MTRLRALIGVAMALSLGTAPAAGRTAAGAAAAIPTCAAAVIGHPAFSPADLDELRSSRLVATHTLEVTTDFGVTLVNEGSVKLSVPAPASVIPPHGDIDAGPGGLIFVSPAAGVVPVTATWTQDDGSGGTCQGSSVASLRIQRANPIRRLVDIRATEHLHPNLRWDLLWRYGANLARSADLDPVTVMARGVSQPRLPGAHVPFKRVTVPLRLGDPKFNDTRQYAIRIPRWIVTTGGDHHAFYLDGDERGIPSPQDVPLGYEVTVLQSGRLIAHLRLAGQCNSTICNMRTIKVNLG